MPLQRSNASPLLKTNAMNSKTFSPKKLGWIMKPQNKQQIQSFHSIAYSEIPNFIHQKG